jgi:hypothetical protein
MLKTATMISHFQSTVLSTSPSTPIFPFPHLTNNSVGRFTARWLDYVSPPLDSNPYGPRILKTYIPATIPFPDASVSMILLFSSVAQLIPSSDGTAQQWHNYVEEFTDHTGNTIIIVCQVSSDG